MAAASAALVLAVPGGTRADSMGAWAWAHDSSAASYSPFAGYSWNGSGGAITISRQGTGNYVVHFADVGPHVGGNVQVSAYRGTGYCKSAAWIPSANGITAEVRCFSASGAPEDALYAISYMRRTGSTPMSSGYAWNNLSDSTGIPSSSYQWTDTGLGFFSRHIVPGIYRVTARAGGFSPNFATVTAYGSGNSYCGVGELSTAVDGSDVEVIVRCFDSGGNKANSRFNLVLGKNPIHAPSWMWASVDGSGGVGANRVSIHDGSVVLGNAVQTGRQSTGRYWIKSADIMPVNNSIALVSGHPAVERAARCRIDFWGSDEQTGGTTIDVSCHDPSGNLQDSGFNLMFASTHGVLE
jgi:hypothetical protein